MFGSIRKILRKQGGFTMMELLIVVNIIGILSAIVAQVGLTYMEKARQKITKENLRVIRQALTMYSLDTGHYPDKLVVGNYCSGETGESRGGGNTIFPNISSYIRKIPTNQIPGEDDNFPPNWVTQFDSATLSAQVLAVFLGRYDGWVYFQYVDGVEVGDIFVPRNGEDLDGTLYSEW